jgi:hypothetical protein
VRDFQKDHFDQDLRSWSVQIRNHLADVLTGFVVGDDHKPARLGSLETMASPTSPGP